MITEQRYQDDLFKRTRCDVKLRGTTVKDQGERNSNLGRVVGERITRKASYRVTGGIANE